MFPFTDSQHVDATITSGASGGSRSGSASPARTPRSVVLATLVAILAWHTGGWAATTAPPPVETPRDLTLSDAIHLTIEANPGLRGLSLEARKAKGKSRQAGARPNPVLSLDLENFGGTMPGLSAAEATLSLGQTIELGGKRGARLGAARAEEAVVRLDIASGRVTLAAEAAIRFLEALAADRSLTLADEEVAAAQEAVSTTEQRVRAGAAHPVENRRAEVELANAKLERVAAGVEASLAHARLSLLWGEPEPRFEKLSGVIDSLPTPPPLDSLVQRAEAAPLLERWAAEREARHRRLALERTRRVPDFTAAAGLRSLRETDDRAFIGGLSLSLPFFDRNLGSIDEATAALEQATSEHAQARLEIRQAIGEALAGLRRAAGKLESLRRDVLPGAQKAFEEMQFGFERGRFTYLDLLEARRTWIRARRAELETLLAGHLGLIELERLSGGRLEASSVEGGIGR